MVGSIGVPSSPSLLGWSVFAHVVPLRTLYGRGSKVLWRFRGDLVACTRGVRGQPFSTPLYIYRLIIDYWILNLEYWILNIEYSIPSLYCNLHCAYMFNHCAPLGLHALQVLSCHDWEFTIIVLSVLWWSLAWNHPENKCVNTCHLRLCVLCSHMS